MKNLHQHITQQIIEQLEQGTKPWECPWIHDQPSASLPVNFKTGNRYQGINILLLWIMAQKKGYHSNAWLTFKQAKELGAHVRKGEKACLGIFYKLLEKPVKPGDKDYPKTGNGESAVVKFPVINAFYLFNLDQIDGIDQEPSTYPLETFTPHEKAEQLLRASGATIHEGGDRAYYDCVSDDITLPHRQRFRCEADFYTTALHELCHWCGHPSRLNRDFSSKFGSRSYAFEELIAELGSAFLDADLGLTGQLEQHASYIDHWIAILKNDNRAIFKAASLASATHAYLNDLDKKASDSTTGP